MPVTMSCCYSSHTYTADITNSKILPLFTREREKDCRHAWNSHFSMTSYYWLLFDVQGMEILTIYSFLSDADWSQSSFVAITLKKSFKRNKKEYNKFYLLLLLHPRLAFNHAALICGGCYCFFFFSHLLILYKIPRRGIGRFSAQEECSFLLIIIFSVLWNDKNPY